ncbi:Alpha/Beta hydrolase protein [Cristinia sonorae]|uniref:Carboxylic ester hydrolase n=1 Tax=Cristinia sonorae TaxID=1940300 RepID=A0A8K0UMM9_9AGAR|nr:Alpha/Beta hydrolase protein [Cristinia sonorae]
MAHLPRLVLLISFLASLGATTHHDPDVASQVAVFLDDAVFVGSRHDGINRFLGIQYAKPPVGELRLNRPVPIEPYTGTYDASEFGPSCPQQHIPIPPEFPSGIDLARMVKLLALIYNATTPQSEDCLSLNVWTPWGSQTEARLPVVVWIHGGGFQVGGSAQVDGSIIVKRSIELGEPIIVVSINYRLSLLGWPLGHEAELAGIGNLGYRDQRLALRWIQKYIASFGGDPSRVTLWGESAGSMSIASQMLSNNGDQQGLFRGAFMHSGSLVALGDMSGAQEYYDNLVKGVGCATSADTLDCLRRLSYEDIKAGLDASPSFFSHQTLALTWGPRADGDFIKDLPLKHAANATIARIPVVIGACDDEGSIFVLPILDILTTEELHTYLSTYFFLNATRDEIDDLLGVYPDDPTLGSPFNTGQLNALSPQSKRIAAIIGDIVFESPRKQWLERLAGSQDVWTFRTKRGKGIDGIGASHISDLLEVFMPSDMTDHLIHFVNYLDPNGSPQDLTVLPPLGQELLSVGGNTIWPKYDSQEKQMLVYVDGVQRVEIARDVERERQLGYMSEFLKLNWIR